ncbi:16S rRNA (guanine(527)-N(7))-methyltransferase RsmG [Paenibacillus endoradicis]|uniref:16S rRNA (guanine(527)-N(7))-methyltransferase RsmG n=1 Tax=Paenibacillus endoradicis TaxID=2972487 RepID=UPI002158D8B3|nr:16S rRNA (guanine(527)-N(7))-methyltransferase RsmG [Paenibacillus endoradicis]MCR8658476.1 16S rRNA (guanine(527)-N(7))-methyltransferase RsmG [Paenibacillus endoradicis]
MDQTIQWFTEQLRSHQIELSEQQLIQLERYYELLVEWNEKMNLTGITERDAVYEKHFYDSISLAFYVDMKSKRNIADIGSGAGFPSIPLKIVFPHLQVLIVDSLNKRIGFLKHLVDQLGLQDVQCVHGRAEDVARLPQYRDAFELVTARAVARLAVLNEFCLPFVAPGGVFASMKGASLSEELQEAKFSLKELKGKFVQEHELQLPNERSERHIVCIQKIGPTPNKYPRKAGTPMKEPLL